MKQLTLVLRAFKGDIRYFWASYWDNASFDICNFSDKSLMVSNSLENFLREFMEDEDYRRSRNLAIYHVFPGISIRSYVEKLFTIEKWKKEIKLNFFFRIRMKEWIFLKNLSAETRLEYHFSEHYFFKNESSKSSFQRINSSIKTFFYRNTKEEWNVNRNTSSRGTSIENPFDI